MKAFNILGGKVHVVELPESDNPFRNLGVSIKSELDNKVSGKLHSRGKNGWESVDLPAGNWQIVGLLPEVTEEQAVGIVDKLTVRDAVFYYNYNSKSGRDYRDIVDSAFKTALESFHSAIRASGWYLENPHGKSLNQHCVTASEPGDLAELSREWRKAQSRTLPVERTLILEKI